MTLIPWDDAIYSEEIERKEPVKIDLSIKRWETASEAVTRLMLEMAKMDDNDDIRHNVERIINMISANIKKVWHAPKKAYEILSIMEQLLLELDRTDDEEYKRTEEEMRIAKNVCIPLLLLQK